MNAKATTAGGRHVYTQWRVTLKRFKRFEILVVLKKIQNSIKKDKNAIPEIPTLKNNADVTGTYNMHLNL